VDVVLRNLDPTVGLIAPDAATPGTDSLLFALADGATGFNYHVQGLEGVADTGDATFAVEVSAAGFVTDTVTHTVRAPGVRLSGVNATTTTLSPDDAIYVEVGAMNATRTALAQFQNIRAGGDTMVATLQLSDSTIARLNTSTDTAGTVVVSVPPLAYRSPTSVAAGGAALDPILAGTVTTTATIPGVLPETNVRTTTITAPGITLYAVTPGAGLQINTSGYLGASNHGGVDVVLRNLDPTVGLIAPDGATPGTDSLLFALNDGTTGFSYYVQGLEGVADTGDATFAVEVSAAGFVTDTVTHTVRAPGVRLSSVPTTTTTLSPDDAIYVEVGAMNATRTALAQFQNIRAGGVPAVATFTTSNAGVLQLKTTALTGDSVDATVPVLSYRSPTTVATGGAAVDPLTAGSATVTATIPGYLPEANVQTVNVSTPGITLYNTTVGAGLQINTSGYLGASQYDSVDVVIKSSSPSVALVSPNASTPGTDSIIITLTEPTTGFSYYVQGVLGATGTVSISARANGFTDGSAAATVVPPALRIDGLTVTTDTSAVDDLFQVSLGIANAQATDLAQYQNVSAALAAPLSFTVTSSDPAVGQLVTQAATAGTVTIDIPVGTYRSGTSVAAGGVAFRPLAPGSTTVSASNALFLTVDTGVRVVTVNP
jgi:hypothetical protein